ncbi:hypothetical protein F1188_04625 [Roseospira marina]|uniref:Lipoprotein n=1 Tax=Roseospira marina TaxID=140057 RepID=A0A5M6IEC0_9PROT|nr:hypothetical protein [Roseospira marina]KAA5606626.1 hypothetical protein F1188_04625 [Roseospira marina]MBB4313970.1 hypothetical protein [Roseospira marina]MBB5087132.1 hypothetical protein [Roseospira marina]
MPIPFRATVRLAAAMLLIGGLAACASDEGRGWTKAGIDPGQRAADSRQCKRDADDYALRRTHQPDRLDGGAADAMATNPMAQVDRAEAREAYRQYFAECMRAHGYARGGS